MRRLHDAAPGACASPKDLPQTAPRPAPDTIRLRPYRRGDAPALHHVFHQAVHQATRSLYSPAERLAWSPSATPPPWWEQRLADQITLVAQAKGPAGQALRLGFMTLGHDGHLDFAYVLPACQGTGIAARLHDRLLTTARAKGLTRLDTEASLIGRRFFLRQGWAEGPRVLHRFGEETLSAMRMHLTL